MKLDSYLPKGISFTRLAIALAIAKGDDGGAAIQARNRWGENSSVFKMLEKGGPMGLNGMLTKASVAAGSTESGNWAAELVSAESARSEFFALVRERSLIGRISGFRRVPLQTRLVVEESGFSAAWVGEGTAVPLSNATYAEGSALPNRRVSALGVFTDELLRSIDPAAELLIRDGLVNACVEAIDLTLLDPTNAGTANIKPASITNGVTGAGATGDGLVDVRNMIDALDAAGADLQRAVLIGSASSFAALHDPIYLPNLGVRGGDVLGIPAIPSQQAADNLILVDPDGIALGEGGMELKVSTEGTIQMLDNPTNDAVTPTQTTLVSLWQCDSTAVMAEKFINWEVARPSVAIVTGVLTS